MIVKAVKRFCGITAVIVVAILCYYFLRIWHGHFLAGSLYLSDDVISRMDMAVIAKNYEDLLEEEGFVYAITFEDIPFGYTPESPCVSIGRGGKERWVALRIYDGSRNLLPDDKEFTYEGSYRRWGSIYNQLFGRAALCMTRFVLESNYVSIAVYSMGYGDPTKELESDMNMIMNSVLNGKDE